MARLCGLVCFKDVFLFFRGHRFTKQLLVKIVETLTILFLRLWPMWSVWPFGKQRWQHKFLHADDWAMKDGYFHLLSIVMSHVCDLWLAGCILLKISDTPFWNSKAWKLHKNYLLHGMIFFQCYPIINPLWSSLSITLW